MSMESSIGPWTPPEEDLRQSQVTQDHPIMELMKAASDAKFAAARSSVSRNGTQVLNAWQDTWRESQMNQLDQHQHSRNANDYLRDEGGPASPDALISDFNKSGHFVPSDSEGNMGWYQNRGQELGPPSGSGKVGI